MTQFKGSLSAGAIYQHVYPWGKTQSFSFSRGYNPRLRLFLDKNENGTLSRTLGIHLLNAEYTGWSITLNKYYQLEFNLVKYNKECPSTLKIIDDLIISTVQIAGIDPTKNEHLTTKYYVDSRIQSNLPDLTPYALKIDLANYVLITDFTTYQTAVEQIYTTYSYLSNNYYTKTDIDNTLNNYYTKTQIDSNFLNYYNKTQIDNNYYSKTQIDSNYYNKAQIDNIRNLYYNKTKTDEKINAIIDYLPENFYYKTEIDNFFSNYYTKTQIDNNFANYYNKTQIDNTFSNYYNKPEIDNKIHQLKRELRKGRLIPPCFFKEINLGGDRYITFVSCHPITGQWVVAYGTDVNHNQHRFINGFYYSDDDGGTWHSSPWYNSISYSQTALLVPNQTGWSIFFLGGTNKVNIISDIATETIGDVQTINQTFSYHALNFAFSNITNKIYFSDQTNDSNRYVRLWSSSDKGSNWVLEYTDNIWKMGGDTRFILCHNPATATIFVAGTQYLPGDSGNSLTDGVPGFLYTLNSNTVYRQNAPLYYHDTSTRYIANSIAPCLNGEFYITGNSHYPMLVSLMGSGERVTNYQLGNPLFCVPHYPSNTTIFVGNMATNGGLSRIHTDNNAHTPIIRLYDSPTARTIVGTMTGYGEHSTYGTSLLTGTTIFCNGTSSIFVLS